MKIIFFGSDDFARVHLDALLDSKHEVLACVSQPDRPKGRGMKVVASPIKECALDHNISILQPENVKNKNFIEQLNTLSSDVFVVIAYGKILPEEVLNIPKHYAINVHASLLPKLRGAAPINWAIINGEEESGISIIRLNPQMDAGDVLSSVHIKIDADETSISLREKMKKEGRKILLKTLDALDSDKLSPEPQDETQASWAPKLTKELGEIDWGKSAQSLDHLVRGLLPWPGAYTKFNDKLLKVLSAEVVEKDFEDFGPGQIVLIDKHGFVVKTAQKALLIKQVHLQDSKPMDAHSFTVGHRVEVGNQLGT